MPAFSKRPHLSNTPKQAMNAELSPSSPIPRYLLPDTAEVGKGGRLSIGGCDVLDLAEEFGTPLFVYDEEHLRARCREAMAAFDGGAVYAAKAFLCKAMAKLVDEEQLYLDAATGGELHVAMAAGFPPSRIFFHGNNKSPDELRQALTAKVGRIVADNFTELDNLEALHADLGLPEPIPVLIRITPGIEAHTHEYISTGQDDSKFGFTVSLGLAEKALKRAEASPALKLLGVHAHIGSQVFRLDSLTRSAEALAEFVRPLGLAELSVGGGLGVPYLTGEQAPSIAEWGAAVREVTQDLSAKIWAEPGRAIAAGAAITLYRIGDIKELPGIRTYVAVDGGMSDNPRPVLYDSGYEAFLPRAADAPRPLEARVVGKHCESGDVLVEQAHLPADTQVGDILATPVTGAYGYSMGSNYNKIPRPPVIFAAKATPRPATRRETHNDLLRLDC